MNMQEVVEIVVKHLFGQGCRAGEMRHDDGDVDENGEKYYNFFCQYRDSRGNKCAAGKVIRDEDYRPGMEGENIESVIKGYDLRYLKEHTSTLLLLQIIHDGDYNWPTTKDMKDAIEYRFGNSLDVDLSFLSNLRFSDR